ncbi:hypothetical protein [Streptomyces hoynatensis]|nr:hypothetical protein [Streptomyces hoynatensis]
MSVLAGVAGVVGAAAVVAAVGGACHLGVLLHLVARIEEAEGGRW